ncbi:MAG: RedB protein [Archangium sp.]|nr:RedB protein [Archangium sp.]
MTTRRWFGLLAGWALAVALTFVGIARYKSEPGLPAAAPARWPEASGLPRTAGMATVLLFAHPRCPCTRASILELNEVMNRADVRQRARAVVVFFQSDASVERSDLWKFVSQMPSTDIALDASQVERHRFGARTSGQVEVFDAEGALVFSGGITGSRGHAGLNVGRTDLIAAVTGPAGEAAHPVYGCGLDEPGELASNESANR